MQYEQKTTARTKKELEILNLKDILLPKRRKKKSSLLAVSKATRKRYKKIRRKKIDQLKFIKQVVMHLGDRFVQKIKKFNR